MAGTIESGKAGKILIGSTDVALITSWTFDKTTPVDQFAHSESSQYAVGVSGARRGSGTIEAKWDAALVSAILEGAAVSLKLYTSATEFFTVPAIIENFTVTVNIDQGVANTVRATFKSNGAWTEPTLA